MSEIYKGQTIGTCENLYYVRRDEMEREALLNPQAKRFLDPVFNYRFPWPDEDGQEYWDGGQRDPFRALCFDLPELVYKHDQVHAEVNVEDDNRFSVEIILPCPAGKDYPLKHSRKSSSGNHPVKIIAEKYDKKGRPYTVFACGYCKKRFFVDTDELAIIREKLRRLAQYQTGSWKEWYIKVADRIHACHGED